MTYERIPWNQYFMGQSVLLSLRSTCKRLEVGAVIVRENRVIAGGYNGSISRDTHCFDDGCYVVDGHCVRTIHAEMNAILQCAKFGISTKGAEIYITHFPCLACTKMILQAGIEKIYYLEDYHNNEYALKLISDIKVALEKVNLLRKYFDKLTFGKNDESFLFEANEE
ncbi:MAG: ComE operon protein 2 [Streptococcaceae bacterium]|jgi:dCMP deaminase|nr:ComE operon protein 2 [Streptococcaceae bacterium]